MPPEIDYDERDPLTGNLVRGYRVAARKPAADPPRPVIGIAFGDEGAVAETSDGRSCFGFDAVLAELRDGRRSWLVIADEPGKLWTALGERAGPSSRSSYQARGNIRESWGYLASGRLTTNTLLSATFSGFRWGKDPERVVLDPAGFTDLEARHLLGFDREAWADPIARAIALTAWGIDVASWCAEVGLRPRPGRGGIAAQLLTDARFWPEHRRKVPGMLNRLARPHLPGNHFEERATGHRGAAFEIDLRSAHHHAAIDAAMTDPETLHLRGSFDDGADRGFAPDSPAARAVLAMTGLLRLDLRMIEGRHHPDPAHPAMPPEGGSTRTVYVWSDELPMLLADGAELVRVRGAIASEGSADSLARFARWALAERERADDRRGRWLKALLLSVYGVMAQGPRPPAGFTFHETPAGTPEPVILAGEIVEAFVTLPRREYEPPYANVLDRGLIEARVRRLAIEMGRAAVIAEEESMWGIEAMAIRADSVILAHEAGDGEAFIEWARGRGVEGEWRSSDLTDLHLLSATHFTSREVDKLPGIPRSSDRRHHARE